MKKSTFAFVCPVLILPAILFLSCANGPSFRNSKASFDDVEGKEWILSEVKAAGKTISIDRTKLETFGMGGIYTISFQGNRVSGMGAPNRFFGPYTSGSKKTLSIADVASTLMATIIEPEDLKEHEYFGYLSNVTSWDLRKGKLELYSTDSAGSKATLVFMVK